MALQHPANVEPGTIGTFVQGDREVHGTVRVAGSYPLPVEWIEIVADDGSIERMETSPAYPDRLGPAIEFAADLGMEP